MLSGILIGDLIFLAHNIVNKGREFGAKAHLTGTASVGFNISFKPSSYLTIPAIVKGLTKNSVIAANNLGPTSRSMQRKVLWGSHQGCYHHRKP